MLQWKRFPPIQKKYKFQFYERDNGLVPIT